MISKFFSILCVTIFVVFFTTIVWASLEKDVFEGFSIVMAERWGVVTMVDLYSGFFILAGWIAVREKFRMIAVPWIISLFVLGNLVGLLYVAWRCWKAPDLKSAFLGKVSGQQPRRVKERPRPNRVP